MIVSFHPCVSADRHVILGDRLPGSRERRLIASADAVILPQGRSEALYRLCRETSVPAFPNYEARLQYPGKIGQSRLFALLGLPHPRTLAWDSLASYLRRYPDLAAAPHPWPFCIKTDHGHEASGIFLVQDAASLAEALDFLERLEWTGQKGFVTQEFVRAPAGTLRVVILGKRTRSYWKQAPHGHIAALAAGGRVDVNAHPALQAVGRRWARVLSRRGGIDLAAVDMLFPAATQLPRPLFLEVNYYFGRRGLGGSLRYYGLLLEAIQEWLEERGLDPGAVSLL